MKTCWELAAVVGVDPRPLTMRRLVWMAREKRRWFGEMLGYLMAWMAATNPFGGKAYDPASLNPYEPRPAKTPEEVAAESDRGWAAIDAFFLSVLKKRKKGAS